MPVRFFEDLHFLSLLMIEEIRKQFEATSWTRLAQKILARSGYPRPRRRSLQGSPQHHRTILCRKHQNLSVKELKQVFVVCQNHQVQAEDNLNIVEFWSQLA